MIQLVHCTGANGNLTSEKWTYSSRQNAPFGKPDVENFLVSSGAHIEWEGHAQSGWFIAAGAGSASPDTLVGGIASNTSACYRGNGDPQNDGNGRMCQQMYTCYFEPDVILTYTVGNKLNDGEQFPSGIIGDAVSSAQLSANIPLEGPLPPLAQAEVPAARGLNAKVIFSNNDDPAPNKSDRLARLFGPGSTALRDRYFPRKEKDLTAAISVELVEAPIAGDSDCSKFTGIGSGIAGAISAAISALNPFGSAVLGIGSGVIGAA
ncbi:hypothetical protein HK104_006130, partial [Borealophlyctis nickersoniae]